MDILSGMGDNEIPYTVSDLVQKWDDQAASARTEETLMSSSFGTVSKSLIRERGASFFSQVIYAHNLSILQQFKRDGDDFRAEFVGIDGNRAE